MKVDTTSLVTRYTALTVAAVYILLEYGYSFMTGIDTQLSHILIRSIILGFVTFGACYLLLSRLISQRLGVIYKLIRNNRLNVPSEFENKSADEMLDITERDVKEWGITQLSNREKEELLKKYRQEFTYGVDGIYPFVSIANMDPKIGFFVVSP